MPVQMTEAELKAAQGNLRRNAPKGSTPRSGSARPLYRNVRNRAQSAARSGIRSGSRRAVRAGGRAGGKVAGGLGAIVALVIGTGILIAVFRNPTLVTKPAQFVSGITTSFTNLSKVGTK